MLEHCILIHEFYVRMLYYATLYYASLYYATLYYGTLYYGTLYYETLYCETLYYETLYYETLYYETLYYETRDARDNTTWYFHTINQIINLLYQSIAGVIRQLETCHGDSDSLDAIAYRIVRCTRKQSFCFF